MKLLLPSRHTRMAPPKGTGAHCSKWADVFFFNQGYPKLPGPMQFKPQFTLGIDVLIREQRQHRTLALLEKYLIFLNVDLWI